LNKILFVPPFPLSTQPPFFLFVVFLFVVFLAFSLWWIHTVPNIKMKGKYFQSQTTHLHHPVPCPVSSPPQPPCLPISLPVCHAEPANRHRLALPPPPPPPRPLLQFPLYLKATCLVLSMRALSRRSPTPSPRITAKPGLISFKSRSRMKLCRFRSTRFFVASLIPRSSSPPPPFLCSSPPARPPPAPSPLGPSSSASSLPKTTQPEGIGLCRERGAAGWAPRGGGDGRRVGDPGLCCHAPLGQAFLGKVPKQKPLGGGGDGAPWGDATPLLGGRRAALRGRGLAEPRGATLPVPTASRWPSPLPRCPAWHEAPGSCSIPAPSVCPGAAEFEPHVPPRQARGAGAGTLPCSRAGRRPCDPGQNLAHIPAMPGHSPDQKGPCGARPTAPTSPTAGQRCPRWAKHARSRGPRRHAPTWHPARGARRQPARQHPLPQGQGGGCGGTAAQGGWGDGAGRQDSGEVEVSPSALFYQL